MWTAEHRRMAARTGLRYPSDLTDGEWALIEPMIPPAKRGGRRREVNVREVLNAIFYVLSTGCQWQALPKDLPPKSTAHSYFMLWDWDGTSPAAKMALGADVDGYVIPMFNSQTVIAYNTAMVKDPPASYAALEKWVAANPKKFGYNGIKGGMSGVAFIVGWIYAMRPMPTA